MGKKILAGVGLGAFVLAAWLGVIDLAVGILMPVLFVGLVVLTVLSKVSGWKIFTSRSQREWMAIFAAH